MITLITGAPGTGKTAFAVKLFTEHEYYPASAVLFNVRGWKGAGESYVEPSNPDLYERPRFVFLVDEAQTFWPSRVAGRPVPVIVDHLAKHRHISQDWILTAQHPGQIDIGIRRLVGRHIHLTRTAIGVRFSEAGECRDDLKFQRDESRKYGFPVDSLALYQSDEGVTEQQKKGLRLPKRLIFMLGLVAVLGVSIAYFYSQSSMFGGEEDIQAERVTKTTSAAAPVVDAQDEVLPVTHAPNPQYYLPADMSFPELAKAPRYPVACLSTVDRCKCYDQKTQVIEGMSETRCRLIAMGRNSFAVLQPSPVDNNGSEGIDKP